LTALQQLVQVQVLALQQVQVQVQVSVRQLVLVQVSVRQLVLVQEQVRQLERELELQQVQVPVQHPRHRPLQSRCRQQRFHLQQLESLSMFLQSGMELRYLLCQLILRTMARLQQSCRQLF
jgi:hypothetical protein